VVAAARETTEERATTVGGSGDFAALLFDRPGSAAARALASDAALPPVAAPGPAAARVELVERAQDGDAIAFERLVERWIEPAFRTALALLGGEADARDATQDALLHAWRSIGQLRDPDRFDAWIWRIQLNVCRSAGRRRGRASVREISVDVIPELDTPTARRPTVAEESADLDELERAFERLPPAQRTVLVLHHWQHRPVEEIATLLGTPAGTVKWRLHEARSALARALEEERR
jgi:RNA polymerase sigma-70 factor, ECF subfamily